MPRITDIFTNHFTDAMFQLRLIEGQKIDAMWDAVIMPGPDGAPVGWFVLEIPGVVLGSRLRTSGFVQNPAALTHEDALKTVRSALEALESQRSEQLKQGNVTVNPEVVAGQSGAVLL